MTYAIIGSGAIGHAIATQFARQGIDVMVANSRGPSSLTDMARALGPNIKPATTGDVVHADVVILAIPFGAIQAFAGSAGADWNNRLVIDASNAVDFPAFKPADLGGRLSTEIVAEAFPGARVVKAFNTVPAAKLEAPPAQAGGRRVVVLSGDDGSARSQVAALIERLGYAALDLGTLRQASHLQQFGGTLVAQDLIKLA
ncbi:NADPH-dependent F420 reductase [Mesorhizobium sp. B2-4-12]|uniref:NADPH-dependent F420 reductase n=1 Tax=unclassified Mesorhizobium TaxID=325217 RepID=UPI00112D6CB8|nr:MULTISPECIES: NADPH-dependent F420 reductase [unclassified Mesorhizobium]TPK70855.1 NADPH-dependent F420 reductase [Mesorhizobium sp. B2-4-15]TPK79895.1 NADPH-dependent F420 reductase [Mesorhizobium sp. B2-4-17]TPK97468.1 NADPH-dependent F420 reductase [Mesorhizobium sp. B2-4-12]TPM30688.1 NADPH-dependent F420 reductase [Mesorhizobium sp. B2-3-5]